jgi:hypothetical protein
MGTIQQQQKLVCEDSHRLYASIEAAIEDQRRGSAKEARKNLKAMLENSGIGVFREAAASLPKVTPSVGEWTAQAAYSKSKIVDHLSQLKRMP